MTVLSDVRSDLPAKVWRQLIQQLVHPAEGPLIDAAPEAAPGGAAAVAAPPPAPCPPLTAYVVRLLASAAQSQLAFPVDLSAEPAYEGSVLVRHSLLRV